MTRFLTTARTLSTRILIVVCMTLLIATTYLTVQNYIEYLENTETAVQAKLAAIANTTALTLNGDVHEYVSEKYTKQGDINASFQDEHFMTLWKKLRTIKESNQLETEIYTLVWEEEKGFFEFVLHTSEQFFYRNPYKIFPATLKENYDKGGVIDGYETEHGMWISAFAPIKNSEGKVVGVIHVDESLDKFRDRAFSILIEDILLSFAVLIMGLALVYFFLKRIMDTEEANKRELMASYQLITKKNKEISDSIQYANRIQKALLPSEVDLRKYFDKSYILYQGKEKVSGDFPFVISNKETGEIFVAAVDCTGHGVPGALLSVIGHFLLNKLIGKDRISDPGMILTTLHKEIVALLRQEENSEMTNDGMDIALVKIDPNTNELHFAGANRPLVINQGEEIKTIKGNRFPIGGTQYQSRLGELVFKTHILNYSSGNTIHLFSDGYQDQIGGPDGRKFLSRRLVNTIKDHEHIPLLELGEKMEGIFVDWKGNLRQLDDVLLIGIEL
ncbi:PP2C family protein-serine/threonine phosphatase [Sediminitomix flava]|nr:SpoIIE family protein phosphatase [Sediminitomix flava]